MRTLALKSFMSTARASAYVLSILIAFAADASAQSTTSEVSEKKALTVTKVDGAGMWEAIKPAGRPVLVNFWATWCDPCREEFPDLVKIAADYKGRIDVVTVSLDDPAEIDTSVRRFLADMGAEMPAYLLSTKDEDAVITSVSKEWGGALPFTIIFDKSGKTTYQKLGKFKPDVLRAAMDRTLASATP